MKAHTQTFKDNLTTLGKEINAKVIYTIDGVETELDGDTLGSVTPHYEGNILKSVMKQVDIVSDVDIPLNTEINVQFGMKYDDEEFEYIEYGNYIVYSSEKQEDTNNYKIIAYDKMLYAMKDYEPLFDTNLFVSSNAQIGVAWNNDENSARAVCYVECKPNTTYYVSFSSLTDIDGIYWFEKAQKEDATTTLGATQITQARSFTTQATSNYIGIQFNKTNISQEDINNVGVVITESNQLVNTYPTTINDYINKLCTKINLEFANSNEVFCNYNKQITQELYKDLGYTYRDVLDELAQVTASTICINDEDKLEIRYLNESVNESEEVEGTDLTLSDSESAKINSVVVEGQTTQDGTPTPDTPQEVKNITGLQKIEVCGKNLAPNNFTNGVFNNNTGLIYTHDNNHISYENYIKVLPSTQYYIKHNHDFVGTGSTSIFEYDKNKNFIRRIGFTGTNSTAFTTSSTAQYINIGIYDSSGASLSGFECQVEKGSTATTYEPYKGKSYEINLGKNLFDYTQSITNYSGSSSQVIDNGIRVSCTNAGTYRFVVYKILDVSNMVGQQFTLSLNSTRSGDNTYQVNIVMCDNNGGNRQTIQTIQGQANINQTFTIPTISGTSKYLGINFYSTGSASASVGDYIDYTNIQLEKGSQATSYSSYFEPIFLGEIGNFKDLIFKSEGVNLLDTDQLTNGTISQTDGYTITGNSSVKYSPQFIEVKEGSSYTMSCSVSGLAVRYFTYDSNKNYIATGLMPFPWTIPSGVSYIRIQLNQSFISNLMLNVGTTSELYEPYGSKGKWLLHKEIGKYEFDGSSDEIWRLNSSGTYYKYQWSGALPDKYNVVNTPIYCTHFKQITVAQGDTKNIIGIANGQYNGYSIQMVCDISTLSDFTTWLSNNKPVVYYPLATPTTTEITKDNYPELLSQLKALDKAKTYEGTTNITSSFPIKFSYATDYETINEDYIKNTRASFGEKYGPINSIVLSRSAESDNIYIQDEESIEENGLCEVKIKDNQIMNSDNRNEYLDDLLDYLGGIEYYTNDYESIGITYLDLCDKYKVQIGDTKYDCIMFNDEVEIHDGLNEIIYAKKPEETITDYKKADKTDQKLIKTNLEVDKQAQRITALVGNTEENFSQVQVEIDRISSEVQSTNVEIDELGNEINVVRNSITEQTSEAITDWFNTSLKSTIEDLENSVDSNGQSLNDIKSYVRRGVITDPQSPYYNQAYVELGDTTNQTTLRILPNRIQFLTNGQETAFISNNQLYINESTILTKEKVGHWVTTEDEDGLLNTYWED